MQERVDRAWEEEVGAVGATVSRRLLEHAGDHFAEVEDEVELAFRGLQLVDIAQLMTGSLHVLLQQP